MKTIKSTRITQKNRMIILIGIILLGLSTTAQAASDYLDPLFGNPNGYVTLDGFYGYSKSSVQSDGKVLVIGEGAEISGQYNLVRLMPDGSVDTGFGVNGQKTFPNNSGSVAAQAPDGKIIVVGECDLDGYIPEKGINIARLLENGTFDPTFNGGSPACRSARLSLPLLFIHDIAIQKDGKILVMATSIFVGDGIGGYSILARFNIDGSLDATFGEEGVRHAEQPLPGSSSVRWSELVLQPDQSILITGTVSNWRDPSDLPIYLVVIRLTASGQYDPSFGEKGYFIYQGPDQISRAYTITRQKSGRIIIGGEEKIGGSIRYFLMGITPNGTLDSTFGDSGVVTITGNVQSLLALPDDNLITIEYVDPNKLVVRMFDPQGETKTTFANNGQAAFDFLGSPLQLHIQPEGQILVASWLNPGSQIVMSRLNANIGPRPVFADVNFFHWANEWVERLYSSGLTSGCGSAPAIFCPDKPVTRAQMAVFLLKGIYGPAYAPPPAGDGTGFEDVETNHWAAAWIKQLAAEGITYGCGDGNFCPDTPVNRAQLAVFLLKAKYGAAYSPAPASGATFLDVTSDHWAAAWIEQLAAENITSGCGNGNFCPQLSANRAQMAIFLVKTFNLP
ncbi:MAG: hypothetical protein CVU44_14165 [Chloroflexi bacterium HGW-Chloroflexi-6]|nr:MAG: hypothetical protein CVU44_14165 [Chloroflexi bacterium HGW-Chloroflexi-6]